MTDEGNVVVETTASEATPVVSDSPNMTGDTVVINNQVNTVTSDNSWQIPTQPISETGAADIGVVEPVIPMGTPAPPPMVGSQLDEVQIIEMMSQQARSATYGKTELAKAGFDSELSTAIAYNEAKNRALAIDEYYIKLSRATKEAEMTGYFLAPEDKEMITQAKMAEWQLSQADITNAIRTRAEKTLATVDGYFNAKGISRQGVVTLDKIVKDGNLAIQRGKNAAAAGNLSNMIRAAKIADIQSVYASIQTGASLEETQMRLSGIMSPEDIKTIYDSYVPAIGSSKIAEGWVNSLDDADFDRVTKVVSKPGEPEVREYTFNGETKYIKKGVTDANGNTNWTIDDTWNDTTKSKNIDSSIKTITDKDLKTMDKDDANKYKSIAKYNEDIKNIEKTKVDRYIGIKTNEDKKYALEVSRDLEATMISAKIGKTKGVYNNIPNTTEITRALDGVTIGQGTFSKTTVVDGQVVNKTYDSITISQLIDNKLGSYITIPVSYYLDDETNTWKTDGKLKPKWSGSSVTDYMFRYTSPIK